jgi:hypothetical protein
MSRYGAALALLLAGLTPAIWSNVGSGNVAFAQSTGQPSDGDEENGNEADDSQGDGQASDPAPIPPSPTTSVPGQQAGSQQGPGLVIVIQQNPGMPSGSQQASAIDEGDDIDEGLSNQRFDPDD